MEWKMEMIQKYSVNKLFEDYVYAYIQYAIIK